MLILCHYFIKKQWILKIICTSVYFEYEKSVLLSYTNSSYDLTKEEKTSKIPEEQMFDKNVFQKYINTGLLTSSAHY